MSYYGIYRGVVVGTDPSGLNRLRVSVPRFFGSGTTWAFPHFSTPDQKMPDVKVGTGVWVMFEGGDIKYPVWTGFFTRDSKSS